MSEILSVDGIIKEIIRRGQARSKKDIGRKIGMSANYMYAGAARDGVVSIEFMSRLWMRLQEWEFYDLASHMLLHMKSGLAKNKRNPHGEEA